MKKLVLIVSLIFVSLLALWLRFGDPAIDAQMEYTYEMPDLEQIEVTSQSPDYSGRTTAEELRDSAVAERAEPTPNATVSARRPDTGFVETLRGDENPAPTARSRWIEEQQRRALDVLAEREYDLLIVPLQVRGHALDASSRSLMTLSLAEAIRTRSDTRVADPVLVAQALGHNGRVYDSDAVNELARQLDINTIVVGDVGHDTDFNFRIRVKTIAPDGNFDLAVEDGSVFETDALSFSDEAPPYEVFLQHRDTLAARVTSLGDVPNTRRERLDPDFPADVQDMVSDAADSRLLAAHYLQFLGVLGKTDIVDRPRDMLFERSLVLLEGVDPNSKHFRLLRARAYAYLNRRPAALAALGTPGTPAERAFLEYLNGNSTTIAKHADGIDSPMLAMIAGLEGERLRYTYWGASDDALLQKMFELHDVWGGMIYSAFNDRNAWRGYSPLMLKHAADLVFPVDEFDLEEFLSSQSVTGNNLDNYDVAQLLLQHVADVDAAQNASTMVDSLGPRHGDVTEMLRSLLIAEIHGEINHINSNIGNHENALRTFEEYHPLVDGHPSLLSETARALHRFADDSSEPERSTIRERAHGLQRQAFAAAGGLYMDTLFISYNADNLMPDAEDAWAYRVRHVTRRSDWPQPAYFLNTGSVERNEEELFRTINYTITGLGWLTQLADTWQHSHDAENRAELLRENEGRFLGHPERAEFFAQHHLRRGDEQAANEIYRTAIQNGSRQWAPYNQLGRWHVRNVEYDDALALVEDYPGFSDGSVANAVAQSVLAYEFGSLFYWAGSYEHAAPLYERSAGYNTGSAASMSSSIRLALIEGDYETALIETQNRVRRYDSKFAIRDLIGLAIILGDADMARSVGNYALRQLNQPEIWDGLLILHRAMEEDIDEKIRWAVNDAVTDFGQYGYDIALRYALLAKTIDRNVAADFPTQFRELDTRRPPVRTGDGRVKHGTRSFPGPSYVPRNLNSGPRPQAVSWLVQYGANAIAAVENGDFESAFTTLDEASYAWNLNEFLPYYALASAKVGNVERVEHYLRSATIGARRQRAEVPGRSGTDFYNHLSQAMLDGIGGNHDDAVNALTHANADVLHIEMRNVYTRYQVMEMARLLHRETGDDRYRTFALDLARRNTVINPMMAYTHSFVAMLSSDREERVEALARVLILDPQSRSVVAADREELEEARALAEKGYPMPETTLEDEVIASAASRSGYSERL